ncbi:MAG TPA: hypothetical protein VKK81_12470 [Candidatus Binatia bacterium]|nr:hypothetical protein [Candidatus Binatia bacterium]
MRQFLVAFGLCMALLASVTLDPPPPRQVPSRAWAYRPPPSVLLAMMFW